MKSEPGYIFRPYSVSVTGASWHKGSLSRKITDDILVPDKTNCKGLDTRFIIRAI
jgi:hypothetical protein